MAAESAKLNLWTGYPELEPFYKKAADIAPESFLNLEGLQGIHIGGHGPTRYEVLAEARLTGD